MKDIFIAQLNEQQNLEAVKAETLKKRDQIQSQEVIEQPWLESEMGKTTIEYGQNIIFALLIFVLGKILVGIVTGWICKAMLKSKTDITLIKFSKKLIYAMGMIFVIICALQKLGIPSASMVAAVGAAGLAVGLSLQGALSNFAAGVLIIIFRPFKVGDLIDAGGVLARFVKLNFSVPS